MKWNNLLKNKCPKCGKDLDFQSDKEMMMCDLHCGFMISTDKMEEQCIRMSKENMKNQTGDNFQELSNL